MNPIIGLLRYKDEILSGVTVSFAMVPEVVAFAFVAGVNPLVGLYAAFTVGLLTSLFGGRPGMISGAAGSIAVVSAALVMTHGVEYLFLAVLIMGLFQVLVGLLKWGDFVRMVPHPVVMGFVNGLAIVIFRAQLKHFDNAGNGLPLMIGLVILTMSVSWFLPKISKAVPSSLVAIGLVTALASLFKLDVKTVGDLASIHGTWPQFHIPSVPFTVETLRIALPFGIIMGMVGLTESLLTAALIDQLTESRSDSNRECIGQGIGNVVTGFMGGMGGCAMIGQSVMNIDSGGRKRLSGIVEALCILSFIVFASSLMESVPMAALVGVMFVVVIKTFAWSSLRELSRIPRSDAFILVMVSTITVLTNLAFAVLSGVVLSALVFAWSNAARITAKRSRNIDGSITYHIHGMLFFASIRSFSEIFTPADDPDSIHIDMGEAKLYDHSALEALRDIMGRYSKYDKRVSVTNLSPSCREILFKSGFMMDPGAIPETA